MMKFILLLAFVLLSLPVNAVHGQDCGEVQFPDDYTVTYTYHDGYTWAHVWYGGAAETVAGTAGYQIGSSGTTYGYTAPDGTPVAVPDYPSGHYDSRPHARPCGGPVDGTTDAFPVEVGSYDAATGQTADVYIFSADVLGERTDIPASIDGAGALRLILQVDQWQPGQAYALLVDGVYQGRVTLGAAFGLLTWEAA